MSHLKKIIVTGAAGFISSRIVQFLNNHGQTDIVIVDDFTQEAKKHNWTSLQYTHKVERDNFLIWLEENTQHIDCIIHLGARTDTTEFDYAIHDKLNVQYSISLWQYCARNNVPFIYASSAATYGNGELGYNDDHSIIDRLQPLNPYGISKNEFDKWALKQETQPFFWTGLKFFNVYGPNEAHKGRMASVIWHAFNQINATGQIKLFRSYNPKFKDGEQLRDFIYVKDLEKIIYWIMNEMLQNKWATEKNGLYNLGTGIARSFYDLVLSTFNTMDKTSKITFIDMPVDIRDKYQYFTQANMSKLRNAGYENHFFSLEQGVEDYIKGYLL